MYELTVLAHFSGAHQLRHLHSQCEALHGHNWKIEVSVVARRLGKEGVGLDFAVLKREVAGVLDSLDHAFLNNLPYFSKREPSSENIAKYVFDQLKPKMKAYAVTLKKVTAWESETASAAYSEE